MGGLVSIIVTAAAARGSAKEDSMCKCSYTPPFKQPYDDLVRATCAESQALFHSFLEQCYLQQLLGRQHHMDATTTTTTSSTSALIYDLSNPHCNGDDDNDACCCETNNKATKPNQNNNNNENLTSYGQPSRDIDLELDRSARSLEPPSWNYNYSPTGSMCRQRSRIGTPPKDSIAGPKRGPFSSSSSNNNNNAIPPIPPAPLFPAPLPRMNMLRPPNVEIQQQSLRRYSTTSTTSSSLLTQRLSSYLNDDNTSTEAEVATSSAYDDDCYSDVEQLTDNEDDE